MSIVIPILFFAVFLGLFVPRMTFRWWLLLAGWILLILAYNYFKPSPIASPIPTQTPEAVSRNTDDFAANQT
jgi:hypothetical protein